MQLYDILENTKDLKVWFNAVLSNIDIIKYEGGEPVFIFKINDIEFIIKLR